MTFNYYGNWQIEFTWINEPEKCNILYPLVLFSRKFIWDNSNTKIKFYATYQPFPLCSLLMCEGECIQFLCFKKFFVNTHSECCLHHLELSFYFALTLFGPSCISTFVCFHSVGV